MRRRNRLPFLLVSCWLLGIASLGLASTMGQTYGRFQAVTVSRGATYTTLSGNTALPVSPSPISLGSFTTGQSINLTNILQITNNAKRTVDLTVVLVQDGTATIEVAVTVSPTTFIQRQVAQVSLSGTAGPSPGTISGYLHITGLNGFLTVDVPVSGTISAPAQPQFSPSTAPALKAPTPDVRPARPGAPIQRPPRSASPHPHHPPYDPPVTTSGGSEDQ